MKINDVKLNNIDLLYNAIAMGKQGKNFKKEIGRNINQLYNHISISFHLSEVNLLEAMYLKQICGDHMISFYTTSDTSVISEEKFPEMRSACNKMMSLIEVMEEDNDIEIAPSVELLPVICVQKNVIVEFHGANCGFLFGPQPVKFFSDVFHYETDEEFVTPMPEDDLHLKNVFSEIFFNQFYKMLYDKLSYVDLIVDGTIKSEFYDYLGDGDATMISHIQTPFGGVQFIGDGAEKLEENILEAKKIFSDIPSVNHDESFKETRIYYEVKTSLYTFFEMFLSLPSSFFSDHLDFKIALSSRDFVIPNVEKYGIRTQKHFLRIIEELQKIIDSSDYKLEKYFFMLLNTKITFTMVLSLDNISSDLCLYERRIVENDYYGYGDSYLKLEILKIIEEIKESSKIIYSYLAG